MGGLATGAVFLRPLPVGRFRIGCAPTRTIEKYPMDGPMLFLWGNLRVVTLVVETLVWDMFGYTYLWVLHPVAKLWRLGDVILFTATVCAQPVPSNFKGVLR